MKNYLVLLMVLLLTACNDDMLTNAELTHRFNYDNIYWPNNVDSLKCEINGVMHKYYTCSLKNETSQSYTKYANFNITESRSFGKEVNADYYVPGHSGFEFIILKEDNKIIVKTNPQTTLNPKAQYEWLKLLATKTINNK